MGKRGWLTIGVIALLGIWVMVVGYEFLEKENALWQKKVKAAKEDLRRCDARYSKYRNFDQLRTGIRLPYTSDLPLERWMHQFNTLRAGMSESEVAIIMGAPDYARCVVSKDGGLFVGSLWQYEIIVPQDPANDSQNSVIQVVFGPDAKLKDKNAVNMQPKPTPTPNATAMPGGEATPAASPMPNGEATPAGQAVPAASPAGSVTPAVSPQQTVPAATATPSPLLQ